MNKEEIILALKAYNITVIRNYYIPDFLSANKLFNNVDEYDMINDCYGKNTLIYNFRLDLNDDHIYDILDFKVRSNMSYDIEDAYDSLADIILDLRSMFTPKIMDLIFNHLRY